MMFRWFDFNQRLNDQGLIDFELPQIFHTSIFQHKLKPHILRHDIKANSKQHLYFDRKKKHFSKKSLSINGGGLSARKRLRPHFLKGFFKKVFFSVKV
jgi:hypothetical protein